MIVQLERRIVSFWHGVNIYPSPDLADEEYDKSVTEWELQFESLQEMLECNAYISAITRFLIPDGYNWIIKSNGIAELHCPEKPSAYGHGETPEEALLNALGALQ